MAGRAAAAALPRRAAAGGLAARAARGLGAGWPLAGGGAAGVRRASACRILRSDVSDINFHFAVEDYLMNAATVACPLLYVWRPAPVVTIGRHQNPWKECVLARLEEDGVTLARRRSGGGAVFQDLGCSVFTFIAPSGAFNIDRNLDIVIGALRRCGVKAEKKGRNDLVCDDKKISGSAFKHAPDRGVSLHHGTVLVDTDMQALSRYLTPDKRKLQAKGIASVGARVMNLREKFPALDHGQICDALVAEFREAQGAPAHDPAVEELHAGADFAQDPAFQAFHRELNSEDWRLGRTPEFTHQLETRIDGVAVFDVRLQVVGGKVEEATIYSDALFPEVIDQAMRALRGADYGRRGLRRALEAPAAGLSEGGPRRTLEALTEWLVGNVDD